MLTATSIDAVAYMRWRMLVMQMACMQAGPTDLATLIGSISQWQLHAYHLHLCLHALCVVQLVGPTDLANQLDNTYSMQAKVQMVCMQLQLSDAAHQLGWAYWPCPPVAWTH